MDSPPFAVQVSLFLCILYLIPNWQPLEQLNEPDRYKLNRISLPEYSGVEAFQSGRSDFPADALEKVFATGLTSYVSVHTEFAHDSESKRRSHVGRLAPPVAQMYMRFRIDNSAQSEIMGTIADGADTASHWIRLNVTLTAAGCLVQAEISSMGFASGLRRIPRRSRSGAAQRLRAIPTPCSHTVVLFT